MFVSVLINTAAGAVRQGELPDDAAINSILGHHGVSSWQVRVPPEKLAERLDAILTSDPPDGLILAGGDGTIGGLCDRIAEAGIPLGVLPAGTLNNFARDLGVPNDPSEALDALGRAIAEGWTRRIDLGEENGTLFVNNSSIGFYPNAVLRRDRARDRHGLGKWPAMAVAALREGIRFRQYDAEISSPEMRLAVETPMVFVGNNAYDLPLGSDNLRPRLDGGALDVAVFGSSGPLHAATDAIRLLIGKTPPTFGSERFETQSLEIGVAADRVPVAHDGEVTRMTPPLRYRTRPGALEVYWPNQR